MFQPNARLNGQSSNWLGTDRGTSLNVGVSTRGRSRCHGSGAAVGRGTCNRAIKKPGDYAHSIRTDNTNRFVFVPHLGTDQVFQFLFDEKSGRLTANTPPVAQLKAGSGPRHLITSPDNRFVYLLNELTAMVTTADAGLRFLDRSVPNLDKAKFDELAHNAEVGCPVSKVLKAAQITLDATLL